MVTDAASNAGVRRVSRIRSDWTPRQVAEALEGYSQMSSDASVGYLRGTADAEAGRATVYVPGAPIEMLSARKCDIELAVKDLYDYDPQQAKAVVLYYLRGFFDYHLCASRLGCHYDTAYRRCRWGVRRIAHFLCGYPGAREEVMDHL